MNAKWKQVFSVAYHSARNPASTEQECWSHDAINVSVFRHLCHVELCCVARTYREKLMVDLEDEGNVPPKIRLHESTLKLP